MFVYISAIGSVSKMMRMICTTVSIPVMTWLTLAYYFARGMLLAPICCPTLEALAIYRAKAGM